MILAIPISAGELIDKITILEIKSKRVKDKHKLWNIRTELNILNLQSRHLLTVKSLNSAAVRKLKLKLSKLNLKLWEIEDDIRHLESKKLFDIKFVSLARSIYKLNDRRFAIKQDINLKTDSFVREEKQYNRK